MLEPAGSSPDRTSSLDDARELWAGRFQGVLSTQSLAEPGYPFGSVVPYCLDASGLPLFLLSHLAQHCHNLEAEPRCAYTLVEPVPGDVQQGQRLTCLGECSPLAQESVPAALPYFRYFPTSRVYFEELNFRFYRLVPRRFHYNGDFATARWISPERISRQPVFDDATENALIGQIEAAHAPVLRMLAAAQDGDTALRVAGVDPRGLDLRCGDRLVRAPFSSPLGTGEAIDSYLGDLR